VPSGLSEICTKIRLGLPTSIVKYGGSVHTAWLDAFRLTMAGALLLGRVFSPWDMLAYGVGFGLGMVLDCFGSAFTRATLLVRRAP